MCVWKCGSVCFREFKKKHLTVLRLSFLSSFLFTYRTLRRAGDYREIGEIKKRREDQEEKVGGDCEQERKENCD